MGRPRECRSLWRQCVDAAARRMLWWGKWLFTCAQLSAAVLALAERTALDTDAHALRGAIVSRVIAAVANVPSVAASDVSLYGSSERCACSRVCRGLAAVTCLPTVASACGRATLTSACART